MILRTSSFCHCFVTYSQSSHFGALNVKVQQQNGIMEDKIAELSLQREGLQELIGSLKEVKGASKVAEWYSNIETVRLVELRQRRQNKKLNQKVVCFSVLCSFYC